MRHLRKVSELENMRQVWAAVWSGLGTKTVWWCTWCKRKPSAFISYLNIYHIWQKYPCRHRENMQTPHRRSPVKVQTITLLAVWQQTTRLPEQFVHSQSYMLEWCVVKFSLPSCLNTNVEWRALMSDRSALTGWGDILNISSSQNIMKDKQKYLIWGQFWIIRGASMTPNQLNSTSVEYRHV